MGKSRLLLSLLVTLSLSTGMTAFSKSHHKKADETSATGSVQSETVKETHRKHKSRKREIAAVPDERNDKRESESKERRSEKRKHSVERGERTETSESTETKERSERTQTSEHKRGGLLDFLHRNRSGEGGTATDESGASPLDSATHPGQVYVHGYTRKDGTVVHGYWRNKPHSR